MGVVGASIFRPVVGERGDSSGGNVIRPIAFATPIPPEVPEDLTPYDITAAGLEEAMLRAQLERLNPNDRSRARRHLGLILCEPETPSDDPYATEKAMAKLRHPSVARVWKLRAAKDPGSGHSAG